MHAPQDADPLVRAYLEEVRPILARKCIACHDSATPGPWYAALPGPFARVRRDIEFGRQRLDLASDEAAGSLLGPFEETGYLIGLRSALLDDTMPPLAYLLLHPLSALNEGEKARILAWTERALETRGPAEPSAPGSYRHVQTLVADRCARCHQPDVDGSMNGDFFDVEDLALLLDDGEYLAAGEPEASLLLERISSKTEPMPPSPHDNLDPKEIASVRRWIEAGAVLD